MKNHYSQDKSSCDTLYRYIVFKIVGENFRYMNNLGLGILCIFSWT